MTNPTMFRASKRASSLRAILAPAFVVALIGCSDHMSSPVAPGQLPLWMTNAQLSVGGAVVNGMTMNRNQVAGGSTFFQATLMGTSGAVPGARVQVQARRPGGLGMMSGPALMTLYDDGTHGDPVAGDGTYGFDDTVGSFGFHMPHAAFGEYHYEFFGLYHDGEHTDHMTVILNLVSQ